MAVGYKDAVNKAKQMNYTGINANMIYEGICQVYPFHPCIKDLFARFKENSGFQQTRGFIRLARYMVRTLFKDNGALAKTRELINAYDFDLSDMSELKRMRLNKNRAILTSLKTIGDKIGLDFNLTMHVARHTFAVWALNAGVDVHKISVMMAHSSVLTTEATYAKFMPKTLEQEVQEKLNFKML